MKTKSWITGLNLFNAVSAIGGGIALITGGISESSWLEHMDFKSLYFPGVILVAIVGGSSLLAALTSIAQMPEARFVNLLAGEIMVFWIVVEIASIRGFHILQVIYFISGALVTWNAMMSSKQKD
ncbi:MAG: hypothetical protein WDO06_03005 [Actinomycetota bacterium]